MHRSIITGTGAYLPAHILTNTALESIVETNDAWIVERTGIRQRHIADDAETTADMAAAAVSAALQAASVKPADLEMLLVATSTPDQTMPSTAARTHKRLGMGHGAAMDIGAACSGFVYALSVADSMIRSGQVRNVAVAGAEIFSRILDWSDRSTCILFGDGAGAVILQAAENTTSGIIGSNVFCDGTLNHLIETTGGVATTKTAGTVVMLGQDVFRHAVAKMCDALRILVNQNKLSIKDIDWLVPHQANQRILSMIAHKLPLPEERVVSMVASHANTSAASIPLALDHAVRHGMIQSGQLVAFQGLGSGLTWGSTLLRWI